MWRLSGGCGDSELNDVIGSMFVIESSRLNVRDVGNEGRQEMLTRVAIHNFRCFANFEIQLDAINLLLGINGSGKTSLFQVLRKLQSFIGYQAPLSTIFYAYECPRWSTVLEHKFELDFIIEGHHYHYVLWIEYGSDQTPKVQYEELLIDQVALLRFRNAVVELFVGSQISLYPLDPQHSAIALLPMSDEYREILIFREQLQRMLIIQLMPPLMEAVSAEEQSLLFAGAENFSSWYRFISQDQSLIRELASELSEIWTDFSHFSFKPLGKDLEGKDRKGLAVYFYKDGMNNGAIDYSFAELSDGQRALIAVYTILVYAKHKSVILCLDEPDNYLALTEIQPWLIQLYDLCREGKLQTLLISHHPEIINYLGDETGIWFERPNNGPTVVHRLQDIHNDVELPMAELVARGWLDV